MPHPLSRLLLFIVLALASVAAPAASDTPGATASAGPATEGRPSSEAAAPGPSVSPQPAASPSRWNGPPCRVVVAGEPPFVVDGANGVDGLSLRVWVAVARETGVFFTVRRVASVDDAVAEVAMGHADAAVGPISITAKRARSVSFTLPYYSTKLCIGVTPASVSSPWTRLAPILYGLSIFSGVVVLLLFVVGNLIWLLERHRNTEKFPRAYWAGVGNGMWLAVVTMTSVGYGDTVPVTGGGRLVAAIWMVFTMVFASTLTASIASVLTEYRLTSGAIDTPQELAGRLVAVPAGSSVIDYVNHLQGHVVQTRDLDTAVHMLFAGRVEAVVYHTAELRYYDRRHPEQAMVLSPIPDTRSDFGFALARGAALDDRLDVALLQLRESGDIIKIEDVWLLDAGDSATGSLVGLPTPAGTAQPVPTK